MSRPGPRIGANSRRDQLLAVLADDYPEVYGLVGAHEFAVIAAAYAAALPAASHELEDLGRTFADFIAQHSHWHASAFIADLARVERAQLEVRSSQPAPALTSAELSAMGPEVWERSQLVTVPGLRLLTLSYPIHRYLALARDRDPPMPPARASWVVVWQAAATTMRAELDQSQHAILDNLARGTTLGQAVALAAAGATAEMSSLTASLGNWFRQWTIDGMFTRVVTEAASITE